MITATAEQIVPFENYIRGITRVAVEAGGGDEYNYLGLSVGIGSVAFRDRSLPDLAVDNSTTLDLGVNYRRYFTPAHTFLRPYAAAGVYAQMLSWEYRNAINIGGDIIERDAVGGGGIYGGAGLLMNVSQHFQLFGEARVGETMLDGGTSEGLRNNVLDNYGYYSFKAGVSVRF